MLTVLAVSGHIAYGTLRFVSLRFPCRSARAWEGIPALGGPAVSGMAVRTVQFVFNTDTRRRNSYLNL